MPKLQHDNNMLGTLSNPFEWDPTICNGRGYGVYGGMEMGRIGGRNGRIEIIKYIDESQCVSLTFS